MLDEQTVAAAQKRRLQRQQRMLKPTVRFIVDIPGPIAKAILAEAAGIHCTPHQIIRDYVLAGALAARMDKGEFPVANTDDVA